VPLMSRVSSLWRNLVHRGRVDRDLDEEVRTAFELLVEEKIHGGMRPDDARRAATLDLGRIESIKEQVRHVRAGALVDSVLQDLRYACRLMRRSPGFTLVAALTLALGVGANTAIFTLVDAVVLKTLPVESPDRLVALDVITTRGQRQNVSYPLFERLRGRVDVFAGVFASLDGVDRMDVDGPGSAGRAEEARIRLVSGEYFHVLGVRALSGRTLRPEDGMRGGDPAVAVLSHGFWERRFARDPSVIGSSVLIKDQRVTVVGVTSPAFFGEAVGTAPDIWMPLAMQPRLNRSRSLLEPVNVGWLRVMGRLGPGVTEDQAGAALAVMLARLKAEPSDLGRFAGHIARVEPSDGSRGLAGFRERFSAPLRILSVTVAVVLLIACANVANLLLARSAAREREMSVRLAIGAGRGRLIRQLLTESVLLACAGGLLAVLFAWWGSRVLLVLASADRVPIPIDVTPDGRILGFTAAISLASVTIFGVVPALSASKADVGTSLKLSAGTPARATASQSLVVVQVALSLVLLTGAALFVRTLHNLRTRDLGFAADSLLEVRVQSDFSGPIPEQAEWSRQLLERISATPGVQSASFAHSGFGTGISRTCCLAVEGYAHDAGEDREIRTLGVRPGYFQTVRLPLLQGRDFTLQEGSADPRRMPSVAIVNAAFVRRYVGGGRSPVGVRFGWGDPPKVTYGFEVIGIAADAVHNDLREESRPLVYFPFLWGDTFVVRAAGPADAVIASLRHEIRQADRNLETSMRSVSEVLERAVIREKLLSRLSSFFGALAAVLAAIGLYGLMAYAVVRRTREIGIRMALGAARDSVLRSEMRTALRLVAWGIAIGAPGAVVAGRLIRNQLFGLSGTDPVTLAVVVALLAFVAAAAAYVPARRASRVDPMVALRCE
jgi:predicted permease